MMHIPARKLVAALVWVAASGFAPLSTATDFPAGTVTASVTSASGCFNISGPGSISGASAGYSGGDLFVTLPAGGPLALGSTLTVVGIPVGTSGSATATLAGDETLSGLATAVIVLDAQSVPTSFTVTTGPLSGGPCSAAFSASGTVASSEMDEHRAPVEVVQREAAISRTTSGVFVDASNAASFALRSLSGIGRPRALSVDRGGARFSSRGLAAGELGLPIGVWGNLGYTSSDNDFVSTASDSERWHGTVGVDASVTDWLIVGLAGGYEKDDTDTTFNTGNIETDGLTLVTYLGALLSERFSVDLALGRSFLDTDQYRTAAGTRVSSSLDGDRLFAAGNASYGGSFGDWHLTARAGILWLRDEQDAFTESDGTAVGKSVFRVGRAKFGGEIARMLGSFEPYASATYNYSFQQTRTAFGAGVPDPGLDRSDVLLGIGARYFGSEMLSGSLELSTLLGRDNVDEYSVNVLLRADF